MMSLQEKCEMLEKQNRELRNELHDERQKYIASESALGNGIRAIQKIVDIVTGEDCFDKVVAVATDFSHETAKIF